MRILPQKKFLYRALEKSNEAVKELKQEAFNSKTLDTLFNDERFISESKDTAIVISRKTGEPVEIYREAFVENMKTRIDGTTTYYDINLYRDKNHKENIGKKSFRVINSSKDSHMASGYMESAEGDLTGLGIREDEYQISTALEKGFESVPRESYPKSVLYHLKMGFTPVKKLTRVRSKEKVDKLMQITMQQAEVESSNFTPVIVAKNSLFGNRFYFDENTTLALAYLRKIRANLAAGNISRPAEIKGANIELELTGENLQRWADMLSRK